MYDKPANNYTIAFISPIVFDYFGLPFVNWQHRSFMVLLVSFGWLNKYRNAGWLLTGD